MDECQLVNMVPGLLMIPAGKQPSHRLKRKKLSQTISPLSLCFMYLKTSEAVLVNAHWFQGQLQKECVLVFYKCKDTKRCNNLWDTLTHQSNDLHVISLECVWPWCCVSPCYRRLMRSSDWAPCSLTTTRNSWHETISSRPVAQKKINTLAIAEDIIEHGPNSKNCMAGELKSSSTMCHTGLTWTQTHTFHYTSILCWQLWLLLTHSNKHRNTLTTDFDVAVLPGCVWVSGEAPWSVTSIWVPTVIVVEAFVGVPVSKTCKKKKIIKKRKKSVRAENVWSLKADERHQEITAKLQFMVAFSWASNTLSGKLFWALGKGG